jgi:hypothetical protein
MRRALCQAFRLLGYIWSAPFAALGLIGTLAFLALGWVQLAAWRKGALELVCRGPFAGWMRGRNWGAFTFGWTIFFWSPPNETIQRHEHRHVSQVLCLGVIYPFAYMALLALQGYRANWFEADARRAAAAPPQPDHQGS